MKTFLISPEVVDRIEHRMAEKQMTRRDLARAAGVSDRSIYNMLLGTCEIRDITLKPIADALGMSFAEIISGDKASYPQAASTLAHVREEASKHTYGDAITLADAVAAIARQTGCDEAKVRAMVAGLMMGK